MLFRSGDRPARGDAVVASAPHAGRSDADRRPDRRAHRLRRRQRVQRSALGLSSATFKGTTIIVADPNVVSALPTGGYAATEYLDSAFVDAVSRQIH